MRMTGRVKVCDLGGYDELARLARQMTEIGSAYSGYLTKVPGQGATVAALKQAVEESAVLDGALLRSAQNILAQTNTFLPATPLMSSLLHANRNLTQIVEQIGMPKSSVAAAFSGPGGVHEILRGAGLPTTLTASFLQMDMSRMLSASLVAQQRLAVLDRVPLGGLVAADATFRRSVAAHLGRLTRSYERLLAAFTQPSLVARLPLVAAYAPVEYFRHVQTLESVSILAADPDDALVAVDASLDDAVPGIDDLLREFDGSLCPLLVGARQALTGRNPDRARHVTTSLRELFTQVLHSLAPDDGVRSWTSHADHFHDKRPTRRARLLYICRNINEGAFTGFVEDDVRATLSFVESLSAGTHTVESRLSTAQLRSTVARMESLLVFLLQIRNDE